MFLRDSKASEPHKRMYENCFLPPRRTQYYLHACLGGLLALQKMLKQNGDRPLYMEVFIWGQAP